MRLEQRQQPPLVLRLALHSLALEHAPADVVEQAELVGRPATIFVDTQNTREKL